MDKLVQILLFFGSFQTLIANQKKNLADIILSNFTRNIDFSDHYLTLPFDDACANTRKNDDDPID